jgi:hypothetical protein
MVHTTEPKSRQHTSLLASVNTSQTMRTLILSNKTRRFAHASCQQSLICKQHFINNFLCLWSNLTINLKKHCVAVVHPLPPSNSKLNINFIYHPRKYFPCTTPTPPHTHTHRHARAPTQNTFIYARHSFTYCPARRYFRSLPN